MSEIRLRLPELHGEQQGIKDARVRFNVICCGRRFGKSVLSRDPIADVALQGLPTAYFAPTYKMLADYWRETAAVLYPVLDKTNVQEKRLQLVTGGTIDMWSLDEPNAARGRKYAHVAIDEAAMVPRLGEAWQEVIRPTLADHEGTADFYSTPKGRNFFWQLWQRGQDEAQPDWKSWQIPTSANPYIKASEIEAARLELPERVFLQEYLAQFLEDGGGVFRGVRASATAALQDTALDGHSYVIGCDWGRENDYSVFAVIDTTVGACVRLERSNKVEYQTQIVRLAELCRRFNPDAVVPEENSIGAPIIEQLRRVLTNARGQAVPIRPFQTTNASKQMVIDALQLAFEQSAISIPADEVLIGELEAYEMERTKTGAIRYGAPEGMHDDCVIALALAWHGSKTPNNFWAV